LSRSLPDAFGYQWGFVFRQDVRELLARLREGMQFVLQHQELTAQISTAWPESVVARCKKALALLAEREGVYAELGKPWSTDSVAELEKGLRLLSDLAVNEDNLSVRYGELVDQVNVHQLQRGWTEAERSVWPMSWLRKRQLTKTLQDCITGTGDADVAKDIPILVRIRELKSELAGIEMKTRMEFVLTALRFQESLALARQRANWADQEFESIENGRCGVALAAELARLRMLRGLDADIIGMQALEGDTGGLWAGHATRPYLLAAAMRFASEVREVQEAGALRGDHDEVASSECGGVLAADYQRLRQRAVVEEKLRGFDEWRSLTGGTWGGLQTSEAAIDRVASFQSNVSGAIANLAESPEDTAALRYALEQVVIDGNPLLDPSGPFVAAGKQYLRALETLQPVVTHLSTTGAFSEEAALHFGELSLDELITCCGQAVAAEPRLRAWCAWRKVRDEALALSLSPLVHGIECGAIRSTEALAAFETNYSRWWLNRVVDNEPIIRGFVSVEQEKRINDFRALDKRFTDLTRAWVRASLCAGMPKADTVARTSEWGVLRHEINKKKQHIPLRELMKSIPIAIAKLTPCLLMSPLSIAQYLAADASKFDVVVFDEASQIPVWDAIGAMARATPVVWGGPPPPRPPRAFFDRAESSADDEDVEGDLESILDECMGANLPTMNLAWHYRSRNESLIAFSNHRYYGGGLVTFPSPVTEDRAVSFHHVAGIYEKGGARINKPEAKALVADIVARLKSPGFKASRLTIGVVTFNSEQMNLIEDLLDDERRKDPSLEPYFSEMELEPLFVKNLESVQGDERDIIYFSITYGPDLAGTVSMNFGPMNRDGGERRLNVAITRARHELRVFTSLTAEQFDLSRTQAVGVKDLKHFLEFAERGARALAESTKGSLGGFESPFEEAVASALASKGWQVQTQIGASSFRVDLGIVHPDAPGTYLCGVECDGATYHRSATARDRDMLREQVLRGLGWEIVRIWSTDWWIDRAGTLEKVHASLERLLEFSRQQRSKSMEREAAEVEAAEAIAKARSEADIPVDTTVPADIALRKEGTALNRGDANNAVEISRQPELDLQAAFEVNAAAFFDVSYDVHLLAMVEHIVELEGPIRDTALARKIARAHGWQRTGARIQERISAIAFSCLKHTEEDVGVFFWANERGPDVPIVFGGDLDAGRNVDEICTAELMSLAKVVLAEGKDGDEAVAAIAKMLGMHHVRAASRGRFESVLEVAKQDSSGAGDF
jgi:very-short-patch-repair endonuclease